jgi:SMC interacting uncharacterized protein involved in chromosome segregation
MTIVEAFKIFIKSLTGKEPIGNTIDEVIRDGADKVVDISGLDATTLAATLITLEGAVNDLKDDVTKLNQHALLDSTFV